MIVAAVVVAQLLAAPAPSIPPLGPPPTATPRYAPPVPTPHGRARCANPDLPAVIVNEPTVVAEPSPRPTLANAAYALVRVSLDSLGLVTGVAVARSSGDAAFDRAALEAARTTGYAPQIANCVAVASTYDFRADFIAP